MALASISRNGGVSRNVAEAITWRATRSYAKERAANARISALSNYVEENRSNPKPSPARGREIVSVTA